jgi:hypothetical protein
MDVAAAAQKAGFATVVPIEERFYHVLYGSVHCATNAFRTIPSEKWWTGSVLVPE